MAGVSNKQGPGSTEGILNNRFTGCAAAAQTDRLRPYFGSESTSAAVMNFVDGISLIDNQATAHPACTAREDYSSSGNTNVSNR